MNGAARWCIPANLRTRIRTCPRRALEWHEVDVEEKRSTKGKGRERPIRDSRIDNKHLGSSYLRRCEKQ
jgi:hypothetical protein